MNNEKFDFYNPINIRSYNLNETIQYQLNILGRLDNFTRRHSENVANLTCRLCEYLHASHKFTVYCTTCAYLHDIGKLFIPANILQKPDKLTDEEYAIMKTHTTLGYEMCMKDLKLRPYASGALYHHEALDGSGYPNGVTAKDIPYEAQIIRVADEYDAIVTKRQYTTHVNISETLQDLIQGAKPDRKFVAFDNLVEKLKVGKVNQKVLRALFKVVIDDILYEISCVMGYVDYLKEQIKRLELMEKYSEKMNKAVKDKDKNYYLEGIKLLLQAGETVENHSTVLQDYRNALQIRQERINDLYDEIKIIKKLKV